ncbi:MAG: hypothetical protein FIO04_02475 [Nitrosopumilales archaeon]|nr:hypothetical protein [Nitrosopumilales archaeon]
MKVLGNWFTTSMGVCKMAPSSQHVKKSAQQIILFDSFNNKNLVSTVLATHAKLEILYPGR